LTLNQNNGVVARNRHRLNLIDIMNKKEIEKQINVLKNTIKWFKKQVEPHDCGWMYTTIDGLKHRIKVLRDELKGKKPKHWAEYL